MDAAYGILRKYYTLTDLSPVHVVATILSPAYKMDFFYLNQFEEQEITEIKKSSFIYICIFHIYLNFYRFEIIYIDYSCNEDDEDEGTHEEDE